MKFQTQALISLTLPTNAGTGARIVLNGATDHIQFYDSGNHLVGDLSPGAYAIGPDLNDPTRGKTQLTLTGMSIQPEPDVPGAYSPARIQAFDFGAPNYNALLYLQAPVGAAQPSTDAAAIYIISQPVSHSEPGSVDLRAGQVQVLNPQPFNNEGIYMVASTVSGGGGQIYEFMSGSVQNFIPVNFFNGWSNFGGGFPGFTIRRLASPALCLQIQGLITAGIKTDGTVVAQVPFAEYVPAQTQRFLVAIDQATGSRSPTLDLNTGTGTFTCLGLAATGSPLHVAINVIVFLA